MRRYMKNIENMLDNIFDDEGNGLYFWLDTDYLFGDYSSKWALHCAECDECGNRDESTDRVILWGAYKELKAYNPELEESEQDGDALWNEIDEIIVIELGYCPLYDVN